MKSKKIAKFAQKLLLLMAIVGVACGNRMVVSATTTQAATLSGEEITETLPAAEVSSGTYYGLNWSYSAGTLNISGSGDMQDGGVYPWSSFKASVTKIVIDDFVTSIGEDAFYNMDNLASVKIGSRITIIGESAFESCDNLSSVTIPASVTELGTNAFRECGNLEAITFETNSKLTSIGNSSFNNCDSLKRIEIPASVEIIGDSAFNNCDSLISATLEEGILSIGQYAFSRTALKSIELPNTVTTVGANAFELCKGLESAVIGNGLTVISNKMFSECVSLSDIDMGNKVNTIDKYAFYYCTNLKDITWSEKLNYINQYAFYNCASLTGVKFPNSLKEIGESAFSTCDSLKEVETGETITDIRQSAFLNSPVSKFLTHSSNIVIHQYAFYDKSILTIYGWSNTTAETYANTYSIAFKPISTLAAPAHRKIVNVVSGVHVCWNEVIGASTYNLYRATSQTGSYTLVKKGVAASHYIDTTAASGKTYYYKVEAVRGNVKSELSEPSTGITYVGTPDITSRINKAAGIQLGWNKIVGATGYAIYRKPYEGSTWTRVTTISGNNTFTWTDESVKANNGTVYKYTIRALAGSDMKTLSGCRNTGRTMVRLSSRTLNSAVKASATSIKCNWTTSSAVTGYEVRFMVGSTVYRTFTVGNYKTGVKTFTGLAAGNTYKIQVRAYKKVDGVGTFYSAWSTAKTVSL